MENYNEIRENVCIPGTTSMYDRSVGKIFLNPTPGNISVCKIKIRKWTLSCDE